VGIYECLLWKEHCFEEGHISLSGSSDTITSFFDFEPTFPHSCQEQMKLWEEAGEL